MRNLRNFLLRNYFFIGFLFLQVICINLLVKSNQHHRKSFMHSAGQVNGFVLEQKNRVQEFFHLREVNRQLTEENAALRSMLHSAYYDSLQGFYIPHDSSLAKQFSFMPARVIAGSVNKRNNYFTLNRGSQDGIEPDMGVMAQNTIVGFVKDVSTHYATVITLLNEKFTQSVRMPANKEHGLIHWDGRNPRLIELKGIPLDAPVHGGDTVVTRGTSGRFPAGQLIGTVYSVSRKQGSPHHYILVRLAQDLNTVHHVYVVKNRFMRELQQLQSKENMP